MKYRDKAVLTGCGEYDEERLTEIIHSQFEQLGVYDRIKAGMKVVIKPNLIMESKPEAAMITHPAVTAAAVSCIQKSGADIVIAESPGGNYSPGRMKRVYSACGYTELADRLGVKLYTECKSREVKLPDARLCRQLSVVEPFLTADYIVNICKLKTHGMMGMSGAVKNMFGAVPGLMKPELHCRFPDKPDFAAMIVDLCEFLSPNLQIMDAVCGMEGNGPTGGSSRYVGAVMTAYSPYVMDAAAASMIGADISAMHVLRETISRGLVSGNPQDLEIIGEALEKFRLTDYKPAKSAGADFISRLPAFMRPMAARIARPTPKVSKKDCIGCGKCAESCPKHIIKLTDRKAEIDTETCIRCFCCHEMCPVQAIDIKRFGVFNL